MPLPENKKELFDALTYKVSKGKEGTMYYTTEIIRNYKMVTPQVVSIPQCRTDLIPAGYDIIDKRIDNFVDFPDPKLELFEGQKEVYDSVEGSCFINALVGWGTRHKTFCPSYR